MVRKFAYKTFEVSAKEKRFIHAWIRFINESERLNILSALLKVL